MNIQSIIIILIIAAAVIAAAVYIVKSKNKCSGFSGDCSSCGRCKNKNKN